MIMAHQYLGQLSAGLQEAFEANTSIKLAGGVSARDARALSGQMSVEPDVIQRQPKGTFATYVRGLTDRAVPISFPFFVLENLPKATRDQIEAIRAHSRAAYAEPWQGGSGSGTRRPRTKETTRLGSKEGSGQCFACQAIDDVDSNLCRSQSFASRCRSIAERRSSGCSRPSRCDAGRCHGVGGSTREAGELRRSICRCSS